MRSTVFLRCLLIFLITIQCTIHVQGDFLLMGAIAGLSYFFRSQLKESYDYTRNQFGILGGESCDRNFIQSDWTKLLHDLKSGVYGQELAISHVYGALKSHFQNQQLNSKALALSFHGLPGTGKNYVSDIIVSNIYKKGSESRFVHKFNARIHFPNEKDVPWYKNQLKDWILGNVTVCKESIFIFDEIDKFPKGLLNILKPFIDHHSTYSGVSFHNTIFLFLSNVGGEAIMNQFIELTNSGYILSGKTRAQLNLNDFERVTKMFAYNDEGGFKMSDIIGHNVIDHYIPFLPLEKSHVIKCIQNEYNLLHGKLYNIPYSDVEKFVLDGMNFIPEPEQLFSSTGCKRVKSKVRTFFGQHGVYGESAYTHHAR